jgi:copper homeostasis protein (lipoprotein)
MQATSSRLSLPLIVAVLSLAACAHSRRPGTEVPPSEYTGPAPIDPRAGTAAIRVRYEGVLPCADCTGIQTELMLLANGTYVMHETYQGKSGDGRETRGHYAMTIGTPSSPDATVFQLTPDEGDDVRAFISVEEGQALRMLDKDKEELPSPPNATLRLSGGAPLQP